MVSWFVMKINGLLGGLLLVVLPRLATAQRALPSWTRGATCYEIFPRSFQDSNGDGIGDLNGIVRRLDYVASLGVRCIWLTPIVRAASYHGYDATDYYRLQPQYGTADDFRRLVRAAHRHGIRVLVDMVLNHVSDKHPWFQAAMRDTTSPYRNWFRWSKTKPTELNPWGQSNWCKSTVRDEWYYAFFWCGMPDLNYEYPPVFREQLRIARFWLRDMGADGFRLDAVPYLVEENGQVANTPGTHRLLHRYADYLRTVKAGVFTVGEATGGIDTLLTYYPDQLDSYFVFPFADSVVSAIRHGSAAGLLQPILDLQERVPDQRWSPFVENHDRPRMRTVFGGDLRRARLADFLALTMPGIPFVYQGEEIGMSGAKPDERLRTPMQWDSSAHGGFTRGTPWEQLQHDSLETTVAGEDHDPQSLLNLHRRLIHLRTRDVALGEGRLVPLTASQPAVAAYARRSGRHVVLAVVNLSDSAAVNVSLGAAVGALPPGTWRPHSLLGGESAARMVVGGDGGTTGYVLLPTLAPLGSYLFELTSDGSTSTR